MNNIRSMLTEEPEVEVNSRLICPGGFFFCGSNCQLHTVLGSCIAITLWHPVLRIGGMCHFVLARWSRQNYLADENHKLNGRYSDDAMALFARAASRHGTSLKEYQAKIFGGSNMIEKSTLNKDQLIGTINTEAAFKHLSEWGIPVLVAHVGETGYRRIIFNVQNGDVWVKHQTLQQIIPWVSD